MRLKEACPPTTYGCEDEAEGSLLILDKHYTSILEVPPCFERYRLVVRYLL